MKILIVDDEPLVRRSLVRALVPRGHEVYEAEQGWEGLILWRKLLPQVILLDMIMPGLSGVEVLEQAGNELRSNTYVVLMSAYSGENSLDQSKRLNAAFFLSKPFEDIFDIITRIEGLIIK